MFWKLIATAGAILVLAVGTATAAAPTPQGLRADGLRWQGLADYYGRLQGERADGLRYQAMARAYQRAQLAQAQIAPTAGSFDWADAGIGAAAGLVFVALGGAAFAFTRRSRRAKLAH
jgi:hypothetical protein